MSPVKPKHSLVSIISRCLSVLLASLAVASVIGHLYVSQHRLITVERVVTEHVADHSIHPTEDHLRIVVDDAIAPLAKQLTTLDVQMQERGRQLTRIENALEAIQRQRTNRDQHDAVGVAMNDVH